MRIDPTKGSVFVNGERQAVTNGEISLKPGTHRWQMTAGDPVPNAPRIARTENLAGGARVIVQPVAGATRYRYELSRDGGKTWTAASAELSGLADGVKVHVRAIAANATKESVAGQEYPAYISSKPPLPPDGLSVSLQNGAATFTWGEVLGVTEYRLYAGNRLVYKGTARRYTDKTPAPEYTIAAVNGNGEGKKSIAVRTDPSSWLTFDPKPGEPFRRMAGAPVYYPQ